VGSKDLSCRISPEILNFYFVKSLYFQHAGCLQQTSCLNVYNKRPIRQLTLMHKLQSSIPSSVVIPQMACKYLSCVGFTLKKSVRTMNMPAVDAGHWSISVHMLLHLCTCAHICSTCWSIVYTCCCTCWSVSVHMLLHLLEHQCTHAAALVEASMCVSYSTS